MMMSLIFIVASVSLLLLPLTCLAILISLQYSTASSQTDDHHPMNTHDSRSIFSLLLRNTSISSQISRNYNRSSSSPKMTCGKALPGIKRYQYQGDKTDDENSKVECGVCLSAVEQGDEIRELKCNHLYHRECLDSWVSTGNATCPMCRGAVREPTMVESDRGCGVAELLVLEFCDSSQRRRHNRVDNWF